MSNFQLRYVQVAEYNRDVYVIVKNFLSSGEVNKLYGSQPAMIPYKNMSLTLTIKPVKKIFLQIN